MNYTLEELISLFDKQEENIAIFIKNTYNSLVPTKYAITDEASETIAKILLNVITPLTSSVTIFSDADKGIPLLKSLIKTHIMGIVMEYNKITLSLEKPLMTSHNQDKFNPIDNDSIDDAPVARDTTTFTEIDNFNAKIELLCKTTTIIDFIGDLRTILYTAN